MAVPKYCRQRISGKADKAFCRVNGERVYLGVYGSPEAKYAELLADRPATSESKAGAPALPPTLTVVLAAYLPYVDEYYGHKSHMWYHVAVYMRDLKRYYGELPAADFRALKLQELREHWVARGWARRYVNEHVARVKQLFQWATSRELVPPETYQSLCSVANLRRGHCKAHDPPLIEPESDSDVEATLCPHLPEKVAAMVRVQRLCGCRPGELIRITKKDIDRSGDVWTVDLARHKTLHHGKKRLICFGPRAQKLLLPKLVCADEDILFPMRRDSYRRAVHRACAKAKIENWSPNQLRHSAGTEAREKMGLEAAQLHLGHSRCDVTQVYAETSREKALEVARRIG